MRPEEEEKRQGLVWDSLHCVAFWIGSLYMFWIAAVYIAST